MGNPTNSAQRAQRHRERLDWLRQHPAPLARLPDAVEDLTPDHAAALDEALRALQLVRLYAPSSEPRATRWGIRLLVSELRNVAVASKLQRTRS